MPDREIRYTPFLIKFGLRNKEVLEDGSWPGNRPEQVGGFGKYPRSLASFVGPVEFITEILLRCGKCGIDGEAVISHYAEGLSVSRLARLQGRHTDEVWLRMLFVIRFASGTRIKRDYGRWLKRKGRIKQIYQLRDRIGLSVFSG